MRPKWINRACVAACAAIATLSGPAWATTATEQLNLRLTIRSECKVSSFSELNFGSHSTLDQNFDVSNSSDQKLNVQCTAGALYTLELSMGENADGSTRRMKGTKGSFINYNLYSNRTYTQIFLSQTVGTAGAAYSTVTGSVHDYNVYGRIPPQTTPVADDYTDTIAVKVTY